MNKDKRNYNWCSKVTKRKMTQEEREETDIMILEELKRIEGRMVGGDFYSHSCNRKLVKQSIERIENSMKNKQEGM